MRTPRFAFVAVAAATALVLAACNGDEDGEGDAAEPTTEETTRVRGRHDDGRALGGRRDHHRHEVRPALFGLVGPDGVPVGFDVEIGKIIASELGIDEENIEWVETISANREPFIEEGQVDIVAATYTINDERKQVVDFAGPYYVAGQTIMVLESNTDINGPDDLAGKKVCSAEGSTPAERIRTEYPEAELVPAGAYSECLEPLRNGQVDAVTTDNVILSGFVDQNPGEFKLVGETFSEEPYGIGLERCNDDFRTFINDVLEESFEDGRWADAWEATAGAVLETPEPPAVDRYEATGC